MQHQRMILQATAARLSTQASASSMMPAAAALAGVVVGQSAWPKHVFLTGEKGHGDVGVSTSHDHVADGEREALSEHECREQPVGVQDRWSGAIGYANQRDVPVDGNGVADVRHPCDGVELDVRCYEDGSRAVCCHGIDELRVRLDDP